MFGRMCQCGGIFVGGFLIGDQDLFVMLAFDDVAQDDIKQAGKANRQQGL